MPTNAPRLTLYTMPRAWGLPTPSPYCLKLETYLRLAGLDYAVRAWDPRRSPRGKAPWMRIGREVVADSEACIDRLEAFTGQAYSPALSGADAARVHALRRVLEDGLYWIVLYDRWSPDSGHADAHHALLRQAFDGLVPSALFPLVLRLTVRSVTKSLHAQGTGRYTAAERRELGGRDLRTSSALFGDGPFVLGDTPSRWDALVYGIWQQLIGAPFRGALVEEAREMTTVTDFCARMTERCWQTIPPLGHTPPA